MRNESRPVLHLYKNQTKKNQVTEKRPTNMSDISVSQASPVNQVENSAFKTLSPFTFNDSRKIANVSVQNWSKQSKIGQNNSYKYIVQSLSEEIQLPDWNITQHDIHVCNKTEIRSKSTSTSKSKYKSKKSKIKSKPKLRSRLAKTKLSKLFAFYKAKSSTKQKPIPIKSTLRPNSFNNQR